MRGGDISEWGGRVLSYGQSVLQRLWRGEAIIIMSSDSSSDPADVIFRPWDTETETKHKKNVLSESSSSSEQLLNNNRRFLLRKPKTEPSEIVTSSSMSAAVIPQPIHPLTIAMRGLVPDTCLPPHVSMSDTCLPAHVSHMMQVRAVHQLHELQELQMAVANVTDKKIRPKKYKCDQCNACFSNNGQLRGHVRIHTGKIWYLFDIGKICRYVLFLGERPFKCSYPDCGKSFTRNEELTRHKRIHTGVKPFSCPLPGCGKPFGRKDHLKKHMKTHERFCHPYIGYPPLSSIFGHHQPPVSLGQIVRQSTASWWRGWVIALMC